MRSRSKLISFDTVTALSGAVSFTGNMASYYTLTGTSSPSTVPAVISIGPSPFGLIDVSDIPISYLGTRYQRNPGAVLARLQAVTSSSAYKESTLSYYRAQRDVSAAIKKATFVSKIHTKAMTDVSTPTFRKISQSGGIVLSPMSSNDSLVEAEVRNVGPGEVMRHHDFVSYTQNSTNTRYNCGTTQRYDFDSKVYGIPLSAIDEIVGKVYPDLMDRQSAINSAFDAVSAGEFDLPVFLLESRQSFSSVVAAIIRISRIISDIKHFRFSSLAPESWRKYILTRDRGQDTSTILLDAWLEARYAWRPLISDIQSAMKYFSNDRSKVQRRTFRGYDVSDEDSSTTYSVVTTTDQGHTITVNASENFNVLQNARAGVVVDITSTLAGARSLGLLDIAGAAWEIVPWSFVIDWVVNIKGILSGLNPQAGLDQRGSYCSVQCITTGTGTFDCVAPWGTASGLWLIRRRVLKDRTIDVSRSFLPIMDINFDIPKLVDAIALLWRFR